MNRKNLTDITLEELRRRAIVEQEDDEDDYEESESNGIKLYKLSEKVVNLLIERLEDEYYAHYLYRSAANWCHDKNYKKAAAFFDADADTELEHAKTIQKYLTDFNIYHKMPSSETEFSFDNLIDIIHEAYEFELKLMKSYNENSHSVFQDDLTTFDFLQQFREIQRESVVEFNDLINASDLIDKKDKFQVLYFEQTYF
jgi:ferritin